MKKIKYNIYLLCLFLAVFLRPFYLKASDIEVEANVSPVVIHIGDSINYHFIIKADPSVKADIPDLTEYFKDFSIKDFTPKEEKIEGGVKIIRQSYIFNTFLSGNYVIPPISVNYGKDKTDKTVTAGAVLIRVDSMLNEEENDIRDIKPPVVFETVSNVSSWTMFILVPLSVLVLILLIIYYFVRKMHRKHEEAALPPWTIALQELDELVNSSLLSENRIKEYYCILSDILRNYIEKRFGLMAPERTTEEFIKLIKTKSVFSDSQMRLLQKFLIECDLVKFARTRPEKNEADKGSQIVRSFIDETTVKEENLSEDLTKEKQLRN